MAIGAGACLPSAAWAQAADAGGPTTIQWSGQRWNVKSRAQANPGANAWSAANVSVDSNGDLHLAIRQIGGTWNCAEVWTDATFGFGTFQWQVTSPIDQLDPNVVLGLFVYGPTALGPDGTHEFDIEYARFGSTTGDNGWWTVFPNVQANPPLLGQSHYGLTLGTSPATTSRFTWAPTSVAFSTLGGWQAVDSSASLVKSWAYQPANPTTTISQSPMPVHMNLWLHDGTAPTNGQPVEVVVHSFTFSATAVNVPGLPRRGPWLLAASLIGIGIVASRRRAARRPT